MNELSNAFERGSESVTVSFDRKATSAKGSTQEKRAEQSAGLTAGIKLLKLEKRGMVYDQHNYDGSLYRTPLELLAPDASEHERQQAKAELKKLTSSKSEAGRQLRARMEYLNYIEHRKKKIAKDMDISAWTTEMTFLKLGTESGIRQVLECISQFSCDSSTSMARTILQYIAQTPMPKQWSDCCSKKRADIIRFLVRYINEFMIIKPGALLYVDGHFCSTRQLGNDVRTWHLHPEDDDPFLDVPILLQWNGVTREAIERSEDPVTLMSHHRIKAATTFDAEECEFYGPSHKSMTFDTSMASTLGEADFAIFHHIVCFCNQVAYTGNALGVRRVVEVVSKDSDIFIYTLWFLFKCRYGMMGDDFKENCPQIYITRRFSAECTEYVDMNAIYMHVADMFGGDERYILSFTAASFLRDSDYTDGYSFITMETVLTSYQNYYREIGFLAAPVASGAIRGMPGAYRNLLAYCYYVKYGKQAFNDRNVAFVRYFGGANGSDCDFVKMIKVKEGGADVLRAMRPIVNANICKNFTADEKKMMQDIKYNVRNRTDFMTACSRLDRLIPDDDVICTKILHWFFYINMVAQVGCAMQYELQKDKFGYFFKNPEKGDAPGNVKMIATANFERRTPHWYACWKEPVTEVDLLE
ncbi:MAG: hypothetical protein JSS82_12515 [Bacteroidetes bacterium]|nr:hypothetical protein [Bacteroidota bacterium]